MIKVLPKELGPCRVVEDHEVEGLCLAGHRVVAVYTEQTVQSVDVEVEPTEDQMRYGGKSYQTDYREVSHTKFLMTQSKESAIADLQAQVTTLSLELEDAQAALLSSGREQQSLINDHKSQVARLDNTVKSLQEDLGKAREDEREAYEKLEASEKTLKENQKYQDQLQKLWVELGRSKMKEILGSNAEPPEPLGKSPTVYERLSSDDHSRDDEDDLPF